MINEYDSLLPFKSFKIMDMASLLYHINVYYIFIVLKKLVLANNSGLKI